MRGRRVTKQSNRIKLSLKYKVIKKVRQHARKLKRDMKRHPEKYPKKKSDPGVPNSVPFKKALIELAQNAKELEFARRKRKNSSHVLLNKKNADDAKTNSKLAGNFQSKPIADIPPTDVSPVDFKLVIEASDVIFHVLDARDPQGSRCLLLEELVGSMPDKKLIFVLNKANCVPKQNLVGWLKYLRKLGRTIPFVSSRRKSSTKDYERCLSENDVLLMRSESAGTECIVAELREFCKSRSAENGTIVAGVVGLPTGSTQDVIKCLLKVEKKSKPSSTTEKNKNLPIVSLDANINLLTRPGLIIPKLNGEEEYFHLRSCPNPTIDELLAIEDILKIANKMRMMLYYNIPAFNTAKQFLSGLPNIGRRPTSLINRASCVIRSWTTGTLCYFTPFPKTDGKITICSSDKVVELIDCINQSDAIPALSLKSIDAVCEYIEAKPTQAEEEDMDDEEDMECETASLESGEGIESEGEKDDCPQLVPLPTKSKSSPLKRKNVDVEVDRRAKKPRSLKEATEEYDFNDFHMK